MLLDIQGSGYSLHDPEIASADLIDEGEIFFCCGNLSSTRNDTFKKDHLCNKYCDKIGTQKVSCLINAFSSNFSFCLIGWDIDVT